MNKMEKITAVVVTYNRIELLKRAVNSLRKQTRKLDNIIVVNNGCTDGTKEWLDAQTDLDVIHQDNVGGSGGFYRGIEHAYEKGYDWIWCMDDDVYPAENCLEILLSKNADGIGIICPLRNQAGKIFLSEVKKFNLSNPLKSLHNQRLKEADLTGKESVDIEGIVFEGPLFKRDVVEKIGLPNKELFIFYDDSDYGYRAVVAGYRIIIVPQAILYKELFGQNESRASVIRKGRWRIYYHIRNTAYFNKTYGTNFLVKYVRSFLLALKYDLAVLTNMPRNKKYDWSDMRLWMKAYSDGIHERLGTK